MLGKPLRATPWRLAQHSTSINQGKSGQSIYYQTGQVYLLLTDNTRPDTLIRLVCQELESWYLGDLAALSRAHPDQDIDTAHFRKRFNKPDDWQKPSVELARIIKGFQKIGGARLMSQHLGADTNKSQSFQVFVAGVRNIASRMN